MSSPDLKQLKALIALCRKNGVVSVKCGDIELTLGETPEKQTKNTQKADKASILEDKIETDELSPDALLFWSSGDVTQQKLDEAARES